MGNDTTIRQDRDAGSDGEEIEEIVNPELIGGVEEGEEKLEEGKLKVMVGDVEEVEEEDEVKVQLGFAVALEEEEESEDVFHPSKFPSKIGGYPVWLNPQTPLTAREVTCSCCQRPMTFLLQIYVPGEESSKSYHRTLYLYVCRGTCMSKERPGWIQSMKVFEMTLPKDNPFYEPVCEEGSTEPDHFVFHASKKVPYCIVCGLKGEKRCGACGEVTYCSAEHQKAHWQHGHRAECKEKQQRSKDVPQGTEQVFLPRTVGGLWKEYEIAIEEEPEQKHGDPASLLSSNLSTKKNQQGHAFDASEVDEDRDEKVGVDDAFLSFQRRIAREPTQVLRYLRLADHQKPCEPLWAASSPLPQDDKDTITQNFGDSKVEAELQICPQLLSYIGIDDSQKDSLDWGTCIVYTRSHDHDVPLDTSCHGRLAGGVYLQRFSRHGLRDVLEDARKEL